MVLLGLLLLPPPPPPLPPPPPPKLAKGGTSNHPLFLHSLKMRSIKARSDRPSNSLSGVTVSRIRKANRFVNTSFPPCALLLFVHKESITQITAERCRLSATCLAYLSMRWTTFLYCRMCVRAPSATSEICGFWMGRGEAQSLSRRALRSRSSSSSVWVVAMAFASLGLYKQDCAVCGGVGSGGCV